ncbi:hypothetical protein DAI22_05g044350 [Oryza sativa Japonica Group]|nr:hypothetical protein DAI22_05g044350 [Oryza sativa Japonica Group]
MLRSGSTLSDCRAGQSLDGAILWVVRLIDFNEFLVVN